VPPKLMTPVSFSTAAVLLLMLHCLLPMCFCDDKTRGGKTNGFFLIKICLLVVF